MTPTRTYFFAFAGLGMVMSVLGPTLPDLAAHTGTDLGDVGLLFTARSVGYLAGVLLAGRWYDRVAGHPIMGGTLLAMALTTALVPVLPVFWLLAGVVMVLGVAASTLDVGGNTLIVWASRRERVGPAMNTLHFAFGVGALAAPLLVAWAVSWMGGMAGAYWFIAASLVPVSLWFFWRKSPSVRPTTPDAPALTTDRLRQGLVVLFFFLYAGFEVGYSGWVYTYGLQRHHFEPATAAYLASVFWGMLTLGRLAIIPLAGRLHPRTILLGALLGGLFNLGLLLALGAIPVVTWIATAGLGLAAAGVFPNMLAFAGRYLPVTGRNTSWFFVGASLGAMTLPWLLGRFFEIFGPDAFPATLLVDLTLTLALFGLLVFVTRRPATA